LRRSKDWRSRVGSFPTKAHNDRILLYVIPASGVEKVIEAPLRLRVVFVIPALGEWGRGRTLGRIWILVGLLVVPSAYDGKVRHLESVGLLAAALQCPGHAVAHIEVAGRDIGREVQLLGSAMDNRKQNIQFYLAATFAHACVGVAIGVQGPSVPSLCSYCEILLQVSNYWQCFVNQYDFCIATFHSIHAYMLIYIFTCLYTHTHSFLLY
jgi:hypothetical protein